MIAIISLLVSILLPSLNRAKELARIASCQANLHSIGVAVQLYAAEYKSALPPHMIEPSGMVSETTAPGVPWRSYAAYWSMWAQSMNLAILEETDMIGSGKVFYCPSMDNPAHSWEGDAGNGYTVKQFWDMTPEDRHNSLNSSTALRTGYMYNPYNPNRSSAGSQYDQEFIRVTDIPADATLALDVAIQGDRIAHIDTPGWNLLSASGGTSLSTDEWSLVYLTNTPSGNTWGSYFDRTYFRGALRSLEEN